MAFGFKDRGWGPWRVPNCSQLLLFLSDILFACVYTGPTDRSHSSWSPNVCIAFSCDQRSLRELRHFSLIIIGTQHVSRLGVFFSSMRAVWRGGDVWFKVFLLIEWAISVFCHISWMLFSRSGNGRVLYIREGFNLKGDIIYFSNRLLLSLRAKHFACL